MKKFRFVGFENNKFMFDTGGRNPAICYVWDMEFPTDSNNVSFQVDWVVNGRYSKGRRKKMLRNGITSLLRKLIIEHKLNGK